MAIIKFLYNNLWDASGTVLTSSSEAAGFPDTRTQHRWKTRCWRSDTDTAEWIKVDLGLGTQDIKALVIKNHNFTSAATLYLQGNATDAWGAPTVDVDLTGLITADTIVYFWTSSQNLRWWRIYIDDGANTDTYVKIGRVFLGSYFEPASNFANNTIGLMDPSGIKHSTGGQYSANEKTHFKTISWGFRGLTEADKDSFITVYDAVGMSGNYFICEDSADAAPYTVTYYVRNTSKWEFPLIKPGVTLRTSTITVETLR